MSTPLTMLLETCKFGHVQFGNNLDRSLRRVRDCAVRFRRMPAPETTLRHWKKQLALNESLLHTETGRFHWLRKLYVRLYQFLVSRYGDEVATSNVDVECEPDDLVSHMPFADLTLDHRGLQPRSTQSLRFVLEQIHTNQPAQTNSHPEAIVQQTRTPSTSESNIDSKVGEAIRPPWIIVASGQLLWIRACEKVLRERGIDFHRRGYGRKQRLEVPFEQRNAAFDALREASHLRPKWRQRTKRKNWEDWPREVWPYVIVLVACLVVGLVLPFLAKAIGTLLAR